MAVDYSHRLIVQGPHDVVRRFRRQMYREYPRTLAGRTWTEIVTFSFAALYEIAPAARRIEPEVPYDPYDLCDWPIRRVSVRQSEVRYRFHTRNLEMIGLIRALSRELPSLTFMLTTFCLDDNSIIAYRLRGGKLQQWTLPERQQQFHWERTLTKFRLEEGEVAYANEEARGWHEEQMLAEAVGHWNRGRRRRYQWWNRPPLRDLDMERELALYEVAETVAGRNSRGAKKGAGRSRKKLRRRR